MRRLLMLTVSAALSVASLACSQETGTLEAATDTLGAAELTSIEFAGSGRWFQFGQAPNATLPWPPYDVSTYRAVVDYQAPAATVEMTRIQTIDPARSRPVPVEQRIVQVVSGAHAWNVPAAAQGSPAPMPQPQPAAVDERTMEIWVTPHGFLKAAAANNGTSMPADGGSEVSFTIGGKHRFVGTINAQNQVEKVQSWIGNTVLGDTLVETRYSDYKDFNGVMFPARIERSQGGHPVLELTVSEVRRNPDTAGMTVPAEVSSFTPPAVQVSVETLARGVHYLTGGSHHSVAIEQADHVVVVEGPQHEERSNAVIAKVKELIPGKPIRYLVNSHVHFDHSGGLRTYVDEGATIVTHEMNRPYYERAWAAPRTLMPDRLARSNKTAAFETFGDKHTLTDGKRVIEVHAIAGSGHNDGFAMVYLPAEKILIEADAYTPPAPNTPAPAVPNVFSVNLHENIQRLKLDVARIAALHGRVSTVAELRTFIGATAAATD